MLPNNLLNGIVEDLIGTCQSIEDVLEKHYMELDDMAPTDLGYIDDAIFVCACCGWWHELSEITDLVDYETVCTRCVEDGDYEI